MKRTTSILLIFVLSASFFINIGIYTWFQLEQAYIASELCENRFVPESDCGGHCVLEKKINDTEKRSPAIVEFKLLSFVFALSDSFGEDYVDISTKFPKLSQSYTFTFVSKIIKPPIV